MNPGMENLKKECLLCRRCALGGTRTNIVFGVGKEDAEVMFVGEGPGEQEDLRGEPFVGRAGQLLDKLLACVDLERNTNIYIANIVKCRPPQNRDPLPAEQETCIAWLMEQIRLIDPKIIVCLGRIAAQRFIGADYKISARHGEFIETDGRIVTATFHPAAVLRNPLIKPDTFEDFIALREKIRQVCTRTYP